MSQFRDSQRSRTLRGNDYRGGDQLETAQRTRAATAAPHAWTDRLTAAAEGGLREIIEVMRILHEGMDLPRHLPSSDVDG